MSKTILFVDDETNLRTFMSKTLRRDGYEVLEADSLAAAREQLATHWIDIIILDRKLPDGEGLALLKELRHSDVAPPVIMLTAYGAIDNAVAAMKMGAHDYLTKPVDREILLKTVDEYARQQTRRLSSVEGAAPAAASSSAPLDDEATAPADPT